MKILRVRRGYTTNSSGGNEWVPPKHLKLLKGDGGTGAAGDLSVKILSGKGASQWSAESKQVTVLATQPQGAETARTTQPVQTNAQAGKRAANLGLIGILVGALCLLFIITTFLRRTLGKKK
ncbi:MAG: hypothetical protein GY847_14095 [Proteobacteria bacterium]|nr:hypothetical protein [Pseudomonadota bacterium]